MMAVGLHLGIDFPKAYAGLFGRSCVSPAPRAPETAGPLPVFPYALLEAALIGGPNEILAASARLLRCRQGLGVRYCAQTLARALLLIGRRVGRRGRDIRLGRQLRTARP
jgi:hypothetical protein